MDVSSCSPMCSGPMIHVASNYDVGELPVYRFTTESEAIRPDWRSFIVYDGTVIEEGVLRALVSPPGSEPKYVELRPGAAWTRIFTGMKLRSVLRVPVRIKGEAIGAISFGSDRPAAYGGDDVELATRIPDHIALAL